MLGLEGLLKVMDDESPLECLLVEFLSPNVLEVVVAGDYDCLGPDWSHLSELVFGFEVLVLTDLFQLAKHEGLILLEVVYQNGLLVSVAVPVLGLVLLDNYPWLAVNPEVI